MARSGIFALGFRPALQVRRAIRYLLADGVEDYAAIVPKNAYGAEIAKILRTTVNEFPGASVLKTDSIKESIDV